MSLVLIVIGLLFLLNPCIWIWDVLPDFIGALLIMIGMRKIAFFTEATSETYRRLTSVIALGIAKTAMSVVCAGAAGNIKLLIAVAFAALDMLLLIPAMMSVVKTLDLLQDRYCISDVPIPDTKFDSLSKLLTVYTVFRIVFGFIPDAAELLPTGRYGYVLTGNGYYPSDGKWMLYVLTTLIILIFTVVVSVILIRDFRNYGRDKTTIPEVLRLSKEFKETAPDSWNSRKWKLIKIPFLLSAFASIFFFVDGVDYLPKWIAAAILLVLSFAFATNVFERIMSVVVNAALAVSAVLANSRLASFFDNYEDEFSTVWSDEAKADYYPITVLLIIEAVLLLASILLMTEVVKKTRLRQMKSDSVGSRSERILKKEFLHMRLAMIPAIAAVIAYPLLRPKHPVLAITLALVFGVAYAIFTSRVELEL